MSGTDRVPVVGHVPSSNGCGSFGLEWKADSLPLEELQDCCSLHDLCYDNCGSDKDACDIEFKKCLYAVCSRRADDLSLLKLKGILLLFYIIIFIVMCHLYVFWQLARDLQSSCTLALWLSAARRTSRRRKEHAGADPGRNCDGNLY